MHGIRFFIEHAGGVFISQCDHWLIHLLFFVPAKNNASESLHLRHVVASFISLATTFLCLASKSHLALMPLLLLSKSKPLRWALIWVFSLQIYSTVKRTASRRFFSYNIMP